MSYVVMRRNQRLHLNDSRCYNGAYFDAEYVWNNWESLDTQQSVEKAERKLKFWTELNDYAVSQRGNSAKCEFKIVEEVTL